MPPVTAIVRTILFSVPVEMKMPSSCLLSTAASLSRRPSCPPVTSTPGPVAAVWATETPETVETPPLAAENCRVPLTSTPGAPLIVMSEAAKFAPE